MEYQNIINLLDSASNQPSKFRTKNSVEINENLGRGYTPNKQIRFKTAMLRSSLFDYNDAYNLLKEIHKLVILLMLVLRQIILIKK